MLAKLSDLYLAHRKLIVALIPTVLPQFVTGDTYDAIIIVLGLLGVVVTPNDQAAKRRVYRRNG